MLKRLLTPSRIFQVICFGLLVTVLIKIDRVNDKMSRIVKPSKRFSLNQIITNYPHRPEWEVKTPPETIDFVNMITQQPFTWIGKGFQATAFVSADGDYVLKFINHGRLQPVPFKHNPLGYLFSEKFRQEMDDRQAHREEIFTSSKMAYEEFPEESGILFVHLNRTHDQIKGIKLRDFIGQSYRIRGDETSFVLQKRARYVLPTLKALMAEGKQEQAEERINQLFDLVLTMARKGFLDGDTALMRNNNIGFADDRAVYIDTGHIVKHENVNVKDRMQFEFDVRLSPLHDWLKIRFPSLAEYYTKRQQEIMDSLSNEQ